METTNHLSQLLKNSGPGSSEIFSGYAVPACGDFFRRAGSYDLTAVLTASRPHIDDIVRIVNEVKVVLDRDDSSAAVDQPLEHGK